MFDHPPIVSAWKRRGGGIEIRITLPSTDAAEALRPENFGLLSGKIAQGLTALKNGADDFTNEPGIK